ncbi:hypothetical protein DMI79_03495 [Akkermansia muciniphila]|nr:hypothetical protein DMI79_03495 [Akkermansia muciniphila]
MFRPKLHIPTRTFTVQQKGHGPAPDFSTGLPPLAVKCCRMRASVSPVNNKKKLPLLLRAEAESQ